MAFTISRQIRQVTQPLAAPLYEVNMLVTDAGDLPDAGVFVMSAPIPEDPKSDTLARVATVADLEALVLDRATAMNQVAEGEVFYYRSAQYTVRYDSLTTAVAAKDVLKSRVDELVIDWQTYLSQFVADNQVHDGTLYPYDITEHPRYDQDAFTLLVKAYLAAVANEASAKTDLDDALSTYTAAQTAATTAQNDVTAKKTVWDNCVIVGSKVNAFISAADQYKAHVITPGDPSYTAAYDAAHNALYTPPTCESFCAEQEAAYNTAVTAKATADTAVATARTAYENAKAAYAAAQTATEMALAAVRTLKPSFNPATDIPGNLT